MAKSGGHLATWSPGPSTWSPGHLVARLHGWVTSSALHLLLTFLTCVGRFPFHRAGGGPGRYTYTRCSLPSLPFYLSSATILLWLVLMVAGYTTLCTSASNSTTSLNCTLGQAGLSAALCTEAKFMVDIVNRTFVFIIFFDMFILNNTAQSVAVAWQGEELARLLTSWEEALARVGFATTTWMRARLVLEVASVCLIFTAVVYLEFAEYHAFDGSQAEDEPTHFVRDTIKSVIIITLKPFVSSPGSAVESTLASATSTLFMFYVYASYKSTIFFYSYTCSTVSQCFKIWNQRARNLFLASGAETSSIRELSEQHFILVQLVHNINRVFGLIIATYFVSLVGIIIFTIYEIVLYLRSSAMMAMWLTVMILLPSSLTLLSVAVSASEVHQEAVHGSEQLRGVDLLERAGEEGRVLGVLLTSLQGPPVTLTALGLFQITRPLILTLSGIILTYFVILIQLT